MPSRLADRLHPDRFPDMSPRMAAIVGCILGERWTEPSIAELAVTVDGHLLARREGALGHDEYVGTRADMERNLLSLIEAAGLDEDEVAEFGRLQRERIVRYGDRR